jgi:RNA polymerase sigma factor (sigma-70 family)
MPKDFQLRGDAVAAPSDESFVGLLERAKRGDRSAWERILVQLGEGRPEGGMLLALARRMLPAGDAVRSVLESRDLIQSTLRAGMVDIEAFRGTTIEELRAWLIAILRHKIGRVLRRKKPTLLADMGDGAAGVESEDPLDGLIREEMRLRIRSELCNLPADQRRVLELRLGGLSAEEIGRRLDVTPETVRKRVSRAAEQIRRALWDAL